jgi:hypothetical protein
MTVTIRRIAILCLVVPSLQGCHLTYRDTPASDPNYDPHRPAPTFRGRIVQEIVRPVDPDSGAYYALPPVDGRIDVVHPKAMLEDLYTRGFDITHAWFRQTGACKNTDTIYPGVFILRLARADSGLERWFHFSPIPGPSNYRCDFGIQEFSVLAQ